MSSTGTGRPTAPQAPADADGRIVEAAVRCVLHLGLSKTSVGDVARTAGVSRGTVYNHYAGRDELVAAALTRIASDFVRSSEPSVRRRRTLTAQVGEAAVFIRHHAADPQFAVAQPGEEEHLLAVLLAVHSEQLLAAWIAFWHPFLASAEARGEIRPGLDHDAAGEWIVRSLVSFAFLPSASIDLDDDAALRRFAGEGVVRGLSP